jgi:hypothetical protein
MDHISQQRTPKITSFYSAYYASPVTNTTAIFLQCLQQCHSHGKGSQWKTAFWAEQIPALEDDYGTLGGQLEASCLLFAQTLVDAGFEVAPEGQMPNAFVWNLECWRRLRMLDVYWEVSGTGQFVQ